MKQLPFLNLLCLRHGETEYTGVFPDLTPDGIDNVKLVGSTYVSNWLRSRDINQDSMQIYSSPAPRSHGTATLLAHEINYPHPIILFDELNAMKCRNAERCKIALKGLSGKRYVDYETEQVFSDPDLFETPMEMSRRWYAYFAWLINCVKDGDLFPHIILVSHYEVFCHIVFDFFDIVASERTALQHVEPIALSIHEHDSRSVFVTGTFRGKEHLGIFDLSKRSFL